MKKIGIMLFTSLLVFSGLFVSCKKSIVSGLSYSDMDTFAWLQAKVKNKDGDYVLWFQVFDQVDDPAVVNDYMSSKERVDSYPAKIVPDKWVWIMVNNRFEIRVMAENKSKDFQSTEKLKQFVRAFDLAALGKVRGAKLKGKEMKKYIPVLEK